MRVERIIKGVKTLGPGERLVIWTNGCNRRCEGCVSARLQEIDQSTEMDIIESLNEFVYFDVDGITISGGEPFIQIEELKKVVEFFKSKNIIDILIYTGYLFEDLIQMNNPDINYILNNIAVLIDGEYVKNLDNNNSNIKGSENQRIIYLNPDVADKYNTYITLKRDMETYYIGNLKIGVGIPTDEYIKKF